MLPALKAKPGETELCISREMKILGISHVSCVKRAIVPLINQLHWHLMLALIPQVLTPDL